VLPLRIIYSLFDDKKGTVIDPYIGSGTTAVAAKLLGCDYIGIDISDEYIKMAEKRINNFESERKIADEEIASHVITGKTYEQRKKERLKKEELKYNDVWQENTTS
jgi:modification methylase